MRVMPAASSRMSSRVMLGSIGTGGTLVPAGHLAHKSQRCQDRVRTLCSLVTPCTPQEPRQLPRVQGGRLLPPFL